MYEVVSVRISKKHLTHPSEKTYGLILRCNTVGLEVIKGLPLESYLVHGRKTDKTPRLSNKQDPLGVQKRMIQELIPEVFPMTDKELPDFFFDKVFGRALSLCQITYDLNIKVIMLRVFVKMKLSFSTLTIQSLRPLLHSRFPYLLRDVNTLFII